MDGPEDPTTSAILEESRFWVQKVLVPVMVAFGVTGNTISVMILTRKRMRSSTNIYLSALAIADIIHLFFVFMLSFKHYPNIHDGKYALYWRFHGLSHWFCDAASSTSVWLTVSFTIERYIAVCHPIREKAFCTERRAKCVIVIVYIFCILTTASTPFEHQLSANETCIKECQADEKKSENNTQNIYLERIILSNNTEHPCVIYVPHFPQLLNLTKEKMIITNLTEKQALSPEATTVKATNMDEETVLERPPENATLSSSTNFENNTIQCCIKKYLIYVENTKLGQNDIYRSCIYWYNAIIFWSLPLALIATFNCFLIKAVYTSQRMRRTMTNSQDRISLTNEKKITLMLIGVIILFIICHTPTASLLIYNIFHKIETKREENIQLILGNIFNFLSIVNASCNFILYCFLSKRFRSTFKKLCFERRKNVQDAIILTSIKSRSSQKFDPKKHGVIRRNASEYQTPRNLETQSLTSMPRSKSLMVRPIGKMKSNDLNV